VLEKARETTKTKFMILESSRDKLPSIAQSIEKETGNMCEEELIDIKDGELYNRSCSQKIAQTNEFTRSGFVQPRLMKTCWRQWKQLKRVPASSGNYSKEPTAYRVDQKLAS
jgi:hypothetical protein